MLGNFSYSNPTKIYFGEDSLNYLNEELPKYGKNVQLAYGGGSIKKNGIYDKVMEILKANGKNVFEDGGVMPNPTVEKLYEGVKIAREHKADLILAVGGGSVCDYAKAGPFPFIVKKIHGRNTICAWRTWTMKLSRWAVSLPWSEQVQR